MRDAALRQAPEYRVGVVKLARHCRHSGMRPLAQARNPYSRSWLWIPGSRFARPGMTISIILHRHLPMPHRGADGQGLRGIDDGVGVDAVVAVEVADRTGLAE